MYWAYSLCVPFFRTTFFGLIDTPPVRWTTHGSVCGYLHKLSIIFMRFELESKCVHGKTPPLHEILWSCV